MGIANSVRLALSGKTDRAGTKVETLATKLSERSQETLQVARTRNTQYPRSDPDDMRPVQMIAVSLTARQTKREVWPKRQMTKASLGNTRKSKMKASLGQTKRRLNATSLTQTCTPRAIANHATSRQYSVVLSKCRGH